MYVMLGLVMLLRGFSDAIMMRTQQAIAVGDAQGYLPPGSLRPDLLGARHDHDLFRGDAARHRTDELCRAVAARGARRRLPDAQLGQLLADRNGRAAGQHVARHRRFFARAGWWGYPPLSELAFSPDVGVDYYLWSLQISGIGTLLTGINFVTTILKLRAPGMTYMRMPVFCWTALAANLLIVAAFPVLTATFVMLLLDRYFGMHFFTNDAGGNQMMYANLFWAWGHPEVYILVLPAFGIFSEVVATFSGKGLFSYRSMVLGDARDLHPLVYGLAASLLHNGSGRRRQRVLRDHVVDHRGADGRQGLQLAVHDVPRPDRVQNADAVAAVGFMVTFVIGGLTGVLLAVPPVDFVLHNSAFLVAHFHNVIIGGVVFGALAGITYWFPKAFGFTLDERLGQASFWCWLIGFWLAFTPLYALGLMGMTRRLQHIADPSWQPLLLVAEAGAIVIFFGILCQIAQLYVSIRTRERRLDLTGDPWNGRTLEWATSSPPPAYNFAVLPRVETIDAFWHMKRTGLAPVEPAYEAIEMPRNSPAGFITAFFAVVMGFSLIWHIWWLAILGFLAAATVVLIAGWSIEREHEISAAEVAQMERAR